MKALIKGSFAFLLFSIFSCTKDSSQLVNQDSPETLAMKMAAGLGNNDVEPLLTVDYSPKPAVKDQPVTITGGLDQSSSNIPSCGKLQLQQWNGTTWDDLGSPVNVSGPTSVVTYSFTPTLVGTNDYTFRVHYLKAGCNGFANSFSDGMSVTVVEPCNGLGLTGVATGLPSATPGYYDFTVTYTVTTCNVQYDYLKLQGGLTDASTNVVAVNGESWPVGNAPLPNYINRWEEFSQIPGGTKSYTVTFTKAYSGSGPMTITGNWSVKAKLNGVEVAVAEFPPIVFN